MGLDEFYLELLERDSGAMKPNNRSQYMRQHPGDAAGRVATSCDK